MPGAGARYGFLRLLQMLSAALVLLLIVGAVVDGVTSSLTGFHHGTTAIRIIEAAALPFAIAGVVYATQALRRLRLPDTSLGKPQFKKAEASDIREVLEQIKDVADNYSRIALEFFGDSLIFQNLYAARVSEEAVIEQGALRLDTTMRLIQLAA
jgi:hypothetical protein